MSMRLATFAICLFFGTGAGAAPSAPQYRLMKTVALGAPDRWDYVVYDSAAHRVYVAHGDLVSVVDGHDGTVLGEVSSFPGGTHGIAIASNSGRGYTDDGKAGTVHSFDPKTFKLVKQIPAAPDADGMVFDPASGHVFVNDGDSGKVTVVDPMTDTAIANIDGGGGVEYSAADGHGKLFVNGEEKNEIIVIYTATNKVLAHYPMPTCERPHGLAIDTESDRVFSTCANGVMVVVDGKSGANIASLPIGNHTDAAAFDPKRKLAFSSNGDGTITIVRENDAQSFEVAGTVKTAPGARTMSIDPETGRLFLVTADIAGPVPAAGSDGKSRMNFVPGTVKLLFFDPQD
jgi:YVTN family beta-propeller protein